MFISFLGNKDFSTSLFNLRSKNGFKTECKRLTKVSSPKQLLVLNHSSKSSELEKTSGSKKLSKAHNSCKLFWSGVPVNKRRFVVLISRTTKLNLDSSFLILKYLRKTSKFWKLEKIRLKVSIYRARHYCQNWKIGQNWK